MKCMQCGEKMRTSTDDFRYDASGLKGIVLVGIRISRCPKCGDDEVAIPRIEELHRLIAFAVIRKAARLAPTEIRFLRKYLGWSGRDFSEHMGVAPETVSRWEQGQDSMGVGADRLLRLMVVHREPASDYSLETLKSVARGKAKPLRLGLKLGKSGWREAA